MTFTAERKEGFWNRSLMAGVTASEMILAQVTINSLLIFVQIIETILTAGLVLHLTIRGSLGLLFTMMAFYNWTGLFFGLFVAILSPSYAASNAALFGISTPMIFLSGMRNQLRLKISKFYVYFQE
jgi:ABC-type multidrug transport system permease subunit